MDDGKIEGMYSEIGLIQGEVTNQVTANGDFYQAGVPGQACTTGSFSWSLEDGGRSFRGFYVCADDGSRTSRAFCVLVRTTVVNAGNRTRVV